MFYIFYLKKGVVYVPTAARVEGHAHYRDIEPVEVLPLENVAHLAAGLRRAILRGNPIIPFCHPDDAPPPILLQYAGAKSWSSFAKGTRVWHLRDEDNGQYQISGYRPTRGAAFEPDPDRLVTLPLGATIDDLVKRMVIILQAGRS
jgi:hypothetical protein